jgi:hypothetical protein
MLKINSKKFRKRVMLMINNHYIKGLILQIKNEIKFQKILKNKLILLNDNLDFILFDLLY